MSNCCNEKRNFGHPSCLSDFGVITSAILVPLKKADGTSNIYDLSAFNYTSIMDALYGAEDLRWYPLPQMNNVEYAVADTQFEESASGKKSHLRNGKVTITGEFWDKDGTAVMKGKLSKVRCGQWGILYITDANVVVGRKINVAGVDYYAPIPVDAQSVDPKFMFKTDSVTQKVMFSLDLDRNFDDSTYYVISGDEIWDATDEVVKSIDFNDLPIVIDCTLVASSATTTTVTIVVNDDYRQGTRITDVDSTGNITGLVLADFYMKNITDNTNEILVSVTETNIGVYDIEYPAMTSTDEVQIGLNLDSTKVVNYSGKINFLIP
jgi:hypothetical protein